MLSVPEIFDRLRASSYAIECADLYEQAIAQVSRQKMPTREGSYRPRLPPRGRTLQGDSSLAAMGTRDERVMWLRRRVPSAGGHGAGASVVAGAISGQSGSDTWDWPLSLGGARLRGPNK